MPALPAISFTDMNYQEAIDYLFNKTLVFQHIGAQAYKPGLETTIELSELFGRPEKQFRTIHVAGTNGKGSTSHLLCSILMKAGYRVGLYTSPHLIDFRERIRVNGEMISEDSVIDFLNRFLSSGYQGRQPSFFELATIMAFDFFQKQKVDIAVIEVGLGGRLDSTNIINPMLSVITNISLDHTQFLGNTLAQIASEKAGIIKSNTPVVIGEYVDETRPVFSGKAHEMEAPIVFAQDSNEIISEKRTSDQLVLSTRSFGEIHDQLTGECQNLNANTVLNSVKVLRESGMEISDKAVADGFACVCSATGLMGRWMKINEKPYVVCDTAHNIGGFTHIAEHLRLSNPTHLFVVIGFVSDKDIDHILELLPKNATYYFTQPSVPRALPAAELQRKAVEKGLNGLLFKTVEEAYSQALKTASPTDMIYVGGSTFVVADFLQFIRHQ